MFCKEHILHCEVHVSLLSTVSVTFTEHKWFKKWHHKTFFFFNFIRVYTALLTKPPVSWLLAVPWFDWYNSRKSLKPWIGRQSLRVVQGHSIFSILQGMAGNWGSGDFVNSAVRTVKNVFNIVGNTIWAIYFPGTIRFSFAWWKSVMHIPKATIQRRLQENNRYSTICSYF